MTKNLCPNLSQHWNTTHCFHLEKLTKYLVQLGIPQTKLSSIHHTYLPSHQSARNDWSGTVHQGWLALFIGDKILSFIGELPQCHRNELFSPRAGHNINVVPNVLNWLPRIHLSEAFFNSVGDDSSEEFSDQRQHPDGAITIDMVEFYFLVSSTLTHFDEKANVADTFTIACHKIQFFSRVIDSVKSVELRLNQVDDVAITLA
ncbi:hypothetical protein KIN20_030442 [Parelaphostrongylus tenuis]|uniref:Uncharacterized protein n=1 Tax=Parelaphostrongylus tenuis TaxID=148309 RepID=A0AAD5R4T7_PARTN|nr:hypothetical protein KIN20_030442 [Parelaphostrongylus tenuis]